MVQESDLPSLIYLQAVVKETLRLHPPGPLSITHSSMEDCTVLGYEIPRGTRLVLNLWAIGRNPKLWEDAESFKPERFMEAAGFLRVDSVRSRQERMSRTAIGNAASRVRCGAALTVLQLAADECMDESKLDMSEENHGLTVTRAHPLFAVPTPRLPVL